MDNISYWLEHCHVKEPYALLEQYKVNHDWIAHGDLGGITARISGRFFEWDQDGDYFVTQGVWADPPSPSNYVDDPVLYDIIAWHPRAPWSCYYLRGEYGLVLGEKAVFEARLWDKPLMLYRTPYTWLKANCSGAVLLDRYSISRIHGIKEVVCESVDHGKRLEKAMLDHVKFSMPAISVPREECYE